MKSRCEKMELDSVKSGILLFPGSPKLCSDPLKYPTIYDLL